MQTAVDGRCCVSGIGRIPGEDAAWRPLPGRGGIAAEAAGNLSRRAGHRWSRHAYRDRSPRCEGHQALAVLVEAGRVLRTP